MTGPLRIYLSGSVRKGASDSRSPDHFWTREDEEFIRNNAGRPAELLNPSKTDIRRQDYALNFGCDLYLVSISDVLLVDARKEKGIGVGAEMMFAVQLGIPVITWSPPDTHYRRSIVPDLFGEDLRDWTHPFVFGLSDHVVDDLFSAMALIRSGAIGGPKRRREQVDALIQRYQSSIGQQGRPVDRFIEIGGGVFQDMVGGGAEEEIVAGAIRFRFMDVLYLPTPTDRIPDEAMVAVNRWRERRLEDRPLHHTGRVRRIVIAALGGVATRPRIIEIGCGKFPLADDLVCDSWLGLEIDREAVQILVDRNLHAITRSSELRDRDLQVDMVVALFCMQFAIDDEEIDFYRRLPAHTLIMFNLATRDDTLVAKRLTQLRTLGLSAAVLDLRPTGSKDALVMAGRREAINRLAAAQKAALTQARAEWPSVSAQMGWTELR